MHPPYARGVSHLMYVGTDDLQAAEAERAHKMQPVILAAAGLALFGGALGVKKRHRQIAGVLAVAGFLAL